MLVLLDKMLYNGICNELKVSHLQDKVKCAVRDIDHLGSKFNEAVKKEYGAQFIKDATYVIGFMEDVEEQKDDEENTEENTEDTEKENTEEKGEETKDDSKEEKEELNESIKVQDLSKSMQLKTLTPKASKTKCVKENESDTKKKSKKKVKAVGMPIEIKKDDEGEEGGEDAGGDTGGEGMAMDEAETTATGADLKKKIIECIVRYFKLNQDKEEEKVELYDLPELIEGKNVYFAKLTIKDNKQ